MMKKKDHYLEVRDKTVIKANDLIQKSQFSLSLLQQKIVLYLIAQITPMDEQFTLYEFDIKDFCQACGIDSESGGNYANLKDQIKQIRDKSIYIKLPNGAETTVAWIEKPYFYKDSGKVQIRLDKDMKPYLLQLKENFTRYELIYTLHFKSKYTIRLYELVKSIHYHELERYERIYTIEELQRIMDAEKYKTYQHFRERALDKAIAEINKYSDKIVSYQPIREGRSIRKIRLKIDTKDTLDALAIRAKIDEEMSYNPNQMTIFDYGKEQGLNDGR